jgi:hypothetical protein
MLYTGRYQKHSYEVRSDIHQQHFSLSLRTLVHIHEQVTRRTNECFDRNWLCYFLLFKNIKRYLHAKEYNLGLKWFYVRNYANKHLVS